MKINLLHVKFCFKFLVTDPCKSFPCLNGATCASNPMSTTNYTCICPAGYQGTNCQSKQLLSILLNALWK